MEFFLKKIHINKLFHLENITIDIDANEKKHLIITGKNGSGKTILLNALVDFLQEIQKSPNLYFLDYDSQIKTWHNKISKLSNDPANSTELIRAQERLKSAEYGLHEVYGKINPEFSDIHEMTRQVHSGNFLFAFYGATRKTEVAIPRNPEKPNLKPVADIKQSKVKEFLKFLVDLKVQEALARNEKAIESADGIKSWFDNFNQLLNTLFEEPVDLLFNYKDYSFVIKQGTKAFQFDQLSDGYSAIIDIIADLILKMQDTDSLTRAYEKQGIVLIDEVETHLHLELQKAVLPFLTSVFPKIQFIVTSHSPFVLNSLKNAVAYDLGKKERLDDLTEYSYEALAEGYFDVSTESSYLNAKLNRFKELAEKKNRDASEKYELEKLENEFDSLNEAVSPPNIKGEYLQIKLKMDQAV